MSEDLRKNSNLCNSNKYKEKNKSLDKTNQDCCCGIDTLSNILKLFQGENISIGVFTRDFDDRGGFVVEVTEDVVSISTTFGGQPTLFVSLCDLTSFNTVVESGPLGDEIVNKIKDIIHPTFNTNSCCCSDGIADAINNVIRFNSPTTQLRFYLQGLTTGCIDVGVIEKANEDVIFLLSQTNGSIPISIISTCQINAFEICSTDSDIQDESNKQNQFLKNRYSEFKEKMSDDFKKNSNLCDSNKCKEKDACFNKDNEDCCCSTDTLSKILELFIGLNVQVEIDIDGTLFKGFIVSVTGDIMSISENFGDIPTQFISLCSILQFSVLIVDQELYSELRERIEALIQSTCDTNPCCCTDGIADAINGIRRFIDPTDRLFIVFIPFTTLRIIDTIVIANEDVVFTADDGARVLSIIPTCSIDSMFLQELDGARDKSIEDIFKNKLSK